MKRKKRYCRMQHCMSDAAASDMPASACLSCTPLRPLPDVLALHHIKPGITHWQHAQSSTSRSQCCCNPSVTQPSHMKTVHDTVRALQQAPQGTMTSQTSGEAPLKEVPKDGTPACCGGSDTATDTSSAEEGRAGLQGSGCECASGNASARFGWMLWVAPSVLFAGLCIHSVFEGLAVGLQVRL